MKSKCICDIVNLVSLKLIVQIGCSTVPVQTRSGKPGTSYVSWWLHGYQQILETPVTIATMNKHCTLCVQSLKIETLTVLYEYII